MSVNVWVPVAKCWALESNSSQSCCIHWSCSLYITVWGFSLSLVRKVLTLTRAQYFHTEQAHESKGCLVRVTRQAWLYWRVKNGHEGGAFGCRWGFFLACLLARVPCTRGNFTSVCLLQSVSAPSYAMENTGLTVERACADEQR